MHSITTFVSNLFFNLIRTFMIVFNRTNPKSFWLAGLFSVILLCVFLSLVSVIMLLFSPPDLDDNPTSGDISQLEPEIEQEETREAGFLKKLK